MSPRSLSCLSLILCAAAVAGNEAGFCLQGARNLAPTDAQLVKGSRYMPPEHPVLAAYDWDLSQAAKQQQLTTGYKPCHAEAPIFRYKVFNRVIYVDHDHHRDSRYQSYRAAFLEQLTLSMWLFKDFPNVDLVVDFTDHPQLCEQDIPFLRYSVLNTSVLPASQHYNLTELLSPAWITPGYAARVKTHTRGFTIPSPEAWRDLSLAPAQLEDFSKCMDTTHPWTNKQLKAFWRGQATGCSRGWPQLQQAGAQHRPSTAGHAANGQQQPTAEPHLLRNKRMQMALRLFPYGPMYADVGITSLPQLTPECLGPPASARAYSQQQHSQQGPAGQGMPAGQRRRQRMRMRSRRPGRHLADATAGQGAAGYGDLHDKGASPQGVAGSSLPGSLRGRRMAARHRRQAQQQPGRLEGLLTNSAGPADRSGVGVQGGASEGGRAGLRVPPVRAYRGMASLLYKEGIGLEGWADAALTLSVDGYGPPFRLPQQLLLGSAVLRMTSPYQTWLDWDLVPVQHLQEFAYDLTDLEPKLLSMVTDSSNYAGSSSADGSGSHEAVRKKLQAMAAAGRALTLSRVHIVAQLDAFAWSVARYKQVCAWDVQAPADGDTTWQVLALPADLFQAKGVPETVWVDVMKHLEKNFAAALQHPALKATLQAGLAG